jgi:hypothetical protein
VSCIIDYGAGAGWVERDQVTTPGGVQRMGYGTVPLVLYQKVKSFAIQI